MWPGHLNRVNVLVKGFHSSVWQMCLKSWTTTSRADSLRSSIEWRSAQAIKRMALPNLTCAIRNWMHFSFQFLNVRVNENGAVGWKSWARYPQQRLGPFSSLACRDWAWRETPYSWPIRCWRDLQCAGHLKPTFSRPSFILSWPFLQHRFLASVESEFNSAGRTIVIRKQIYLSAGTRPFLDAIYLRQTDLGAHSTEKGPVSEKFIISIPLSIHHIVYG